MIWLICISCYNKTVIFIAIFTDSRYSCNYLAKLRDNRQLHESNIHEKDKYLIKEKETILQLSLVQKEQENIKSDKRNLATWSEYTKSQRKDALWYDKTRKLWFNSELLLIKVA